MNGEGIENRGFNAVAVRQYKPYEGRNPGTGESVHIASKRAPFFEAGNELKGMAKGEGEAK